MAPVSKAGYLVQDGGIASFAVYAAPCDACCCARDRMVETDGDDDDDDFDCAPAA